VARQRIAEALQHLDDTIYEIRDHTFASGPGRRRGPEPPVGAQ